MTSKRKRTTMALLYGYDSTQEEQQAASASPTPRRSSRLQRDDMGEGIRPEDNSQKSSRRLKPNGRPEGRDSLEPLLSKRIKRSKVEDTEAVDQAMECLRKMEDDFRDTVKRQKRVVDESLVNVPKSAFFPGPEETGGSGNLSHELGTKVLDHTGPVINEEQQGKTLPTPLTDGDPEERDLFDVQEENDINVIKREGARPPPVNSDYLPLPWEGRLGYACLNTYLRQANPPVFCSRTCRIASVLDHRHPLLDPSQPEHPTKNRPDKNQPADVARGQKYVEDLGLANARDIIKMLRWNDKYGIRFLRLSSEIFPFASHAEYGYKLEPFAAGTLAEAGKVAAELGHRLTTHPGQFTQLGSPRPEVIRAAVRDLEYHDEMLTLLRLPEQQNRDAVMIIHMGGVYGDKQATLDRFRGNYAELSPGVKARLVLENDDVSWSVHDLLPVCEELNIPFVLDFHHHNIVFDADKIREGTRDIVDLYPRIRATWDRKGIRQKMHYSEPCPEAVTPRQRRKHSPRVMTLPPCPPGVDLMIEAKDKEQAVLALMRNFRLPGWDRFNDVVPHERGDENKPPPRDPPRKAKKAPPRRKKKASRGGEDGEDERAGLDAVPVEEEEETPKPPPPEVPESELGMGGPNNRVFWPLGMEEWLRPKKREVKKKASAVATATATATAADNGEEEEEDGRLGGAVEVKARTKKKKGEKRKRIKKTEDDSFDDELDD